MEGADGLKLESGGQLDEAGVAAKGQVGPVEQGVAGNHKVLLGGSQGLSLQHIVGISGSILRVIEGVKELRAEFQAFDFANEGILS